tara:strand:- start:12967 stop:13560 length:594 start_codon:yes stop_codon:yes gene_type:complete
MKNRLFCVVISLIFCTTAQAFVTGWSDLAFGIGNLTHQAGKVASDVGSVSYFDFRPVLQLSYRYEFSKEFSFIPELGVTLPETSEDETYSTLYAFMNAPLAWHYDYWTIRFGPGFFFTRISGKGGTLRLQNGATFDEFPVPNGTATTRNLTWNLGVQAAFDKEWSARFDLSVLKLFDSKRRAVNHLLTLNYHFGAVL